MSLGSTCRHMSERRPLRRLRATVTTAKETLTMPIQQESSAVALARAHAEAWSNHDWDTARKMLAPDVHVAATTTQPGINPTDLTGIDAYMDGLIQFAQPVEPGSLRVIASVGDERNSLLLLTVRAAFGPGG